MGRRKRKTRPSEEETQSPEPCQPSQPPQPIKKTRRTRGASLLKKFTKNIADGKRLEVSLTSERQPQPFGDNASKLSTFIGTKVKKLVPITTESWDVVSDDDKDQIWKDVVDAFILPDYMEEWTMKKANDLWRNFKTDLRRYHMHDKKTGALLTRRPNIYDSYITQEQWTQFIEISGSEEFKGKSDKFRQLSLLNIYPYRASKIGYAGIGEKYKADNGIDSSCTIPRAIPWKEARKKKNGEYCEKSREVIEKIDLHLTQESTGEFVTIGRKDVLAMALGKEEHPGRVRGVGQNVSVSEYFGHASRKASSSRVDVTEAALLEATKQIKFTMKAELDSILVSERQERQEMKQLIQQLLEERKQYVPDKPLPDMPLTSIGKVNDPIKPSEKASCSIADGSLNTSKVDEWINCKLFSSGLKKEVAKGLVYRSSSSTVKLHHETLKSGQVKVQVLDIIEGEELVPFPIDEVHKVSQAKGYFIAWPDHLVLPIMPSMDSIHKSANKDKSNGNISTKDSIIDAMELDSIPSLVSDFRWMKDEFSTSTIIKLSKDLFGNDDLELPFGGELLQMLLDQDEIENSHVTIYMSYLVENHCNGVEEMFSFLSPTVISPNNGQTIQDRATYMADAMKGDIKGRLFFAPYQFDYHWVLLVLHPETGHAYWIDSLSKPINKDAKDLVELSYTLKFTTLGKNKPRKRILWSTVQCPSQSNSIDCGYYTLRFMREIISRQHASVPKVWYGRKLAFSQNEIDEVRKEFLEYLISQTM